MIFCIFPISNTQIRIYTVFELIREFKGLYQIFKTPFTIYRYYNKCLPKI